MMFHGSPHFLCQKISKNAPNFHLFQSKATAHGCLPRLCALGAHGAHGARRIDGDFRIIGIRVGRVRWRSTGEEAGCLQRSSSSMGKLELFSWIYGKNMEKWEKILMKIMFSSQVLSLFHVIQPSKIMGKWWKSGSHPHKKRWCSSISWYANIFPHQTMDSSA